MKTISILLILIFQIKAQDIASIFIGSDILLNKSKSTYNVNTYGFNLGLLLPINFKSVDAYYKVRVTVHDAKYSGEYDKVINKYLSASNEFLIGKTIHFDESKFEILPQFGLGMTLETVYGSFGDGSVFDIVYYDLSVLINYPFDFYKLGLMVNLENGFFASHDNYIANSRLNINLAVTF